MALPGRALRRGQCSRPSLVCVFHCQRRSFLGYRAKCRLIVQVALVTDVSKDVTCSRPATVPTAQAQELQWDRRDWISGFVEHDSVQEGAWLPVSGRLPIQLTGTYFRNGPGSFKIGQQQLSHPFDGDGVVCSIAIRDGKAFYRSRFVDTATRAAEAQQHSITHRGCFGTQHAAAFANVLDVAPKNVANTNAVCWGGRCLAMFEAGLPHALQPTTLQSGELYTAHGRLKPGIPFSAGSAVADAVLDGVLKGAAKLRGHDWGVNQRLGGDAFGAHPKFDGTLNRLVNYSYQLQLNSKKTAASGKLEFDTMMTLWEFDDAFRAVARRTLTLDGYGFVHDLAITPKYYIVVQNPVELDALAYVTGQQCAVHCVHEQQTQPFKVWIVPRHNRHADVKLIEMPACFVFHHANAFEVGNDELVLDCVVYEHMPDFNLWSGGGRNFRDVDPELQSPSRLCRMHMNLQTGSSSMELVSQRVVEFPSSPFGFTNVNARHAFAAAALHPSRNAPQQAIAKIDLQNGHVDLWSRGHRYYVGEPQFIADPKRRPHSGGELSRQLQAGGCGGWLLAVCFDAAAQRSEVVLLDADHVSDGPIASMALPTILPHGLHGSWTKDYYGP